MHLRYYLHPLLTHASTAGAPRAGAESSSPVMELVRFSALERHYGANEVFAGLSGVIRDGERVGLVGPNGAGKSSLVRQFIENEFQESYYPTIESSHTKTVKHNGTEYQLSIIDTAGQVCLSARPPECRR